MFELTIDYRLVRAYERANALILENVERDDAEANNARDTIALYLTLKDAVNLLIKSKRVMADDNSFYAKWPPSCQKPLIKRCQCEKCRDERRYEVLQMLQTSSPLEGSPT